MTDNARRAALHAELDRLIDRGQDFADLADIPDQHSAKLDVEARLIARSALDLAAAAMGSEAHARAVQEANPAALPDRLGNCLQLVARFIDPTGSMTPSANELALEISAIAAGDAPRLLALSARKKGRPTNAYRRLSFQLRALEWEALLAMLGMSAERRQSLVAEGFGMPWDTMSRWLNACIDGLGERTVKMALYFARISASEWIEAKDAELLTRIKLDGSAYHAELAAGVQNR